MWFTFTANVNTWLTTVQQQTLLRRHSSQLMYDVDTKNYCMYGQWLETSWIKCHVDTAFDYLIGYMIQNDY